MKKIFFTIISCVALSLGINAQTCGSLTDYIPANNVTIPVNFIFFQPLSGTGKFDTITQGTCQSIINFMNYKFSNLSAPTLPLPAPNTAPTGYTDTKIRFVFKSIIFKPDVQYDTSATATGTFPVYPAADPNALNIVHNVHNGGPAGNALIKSNVVSLIQSNAPGAFDLFDNGTRHLYYLHEVGHALGLHHTYPTNATGAIVPMSQFSNPNGTTLAPDLANDIWYEDFNTAIAEIGNNFMGNSWAKRDYLSPKQIGLMHYMLKMDPVVRQIASQSACSIGVNWPMYSGSYTGPILADGDLVIPQGQHVTISGCVYMKPNARIIVEPGGKLTLNNATLVRQCSSPWKGIEVQSNPGAHQSIDPLTLMPNSSVGMLEVNASSVSGAEIAINVGKFNTTGSYNIGPNVNFTGSYIPSTGAGIVQVKSSQFINNRISANFNPYYVLAPNGGNISYFKSCVFQLTTTYDNVNSPFAAININNTYAIKILNSRFYDYLTNQTAAGVRCLNGSVQIGVDPNLSGQSLFKGFTYGIYLSNWLTNVPSAPSKIQNTTIDQLNITPTNCRGGIYTMGTFGTQITDCRIDISQPASSTGPLAFCLYLDGCDGYVVENNDFRGATNAYKTAGIFVNNSGPGANSIYNNSFQNFQQGIWAQNINYTPGLNGTGLKMNCDDFTNVAYNIGVQSYYSGLNCAGCPPISQPAGVAETQGTAFSLEKFNVRNTYNSPACTNQNKYYVYTDNGYVLGSHGSFFGGQYHPTPQPSCSDNTKVIDIVGLQTQNLRPVWCPANVFPNLSMTALNENKSHNRYLISSLTKTLQDNTDGGHTQDLLNLISNSGPINTIYTALMGKDYLSDDVLKAYFGINGLSKSNITDVFTKNAPVHPSVWQKILDLNPEPTFLAQLSALQFNQNKLSTRANIQSQLHLAHTELGLLTNESARRFLSDTTGIAFDSLSAMYSLNEVPNSAFKQVDAAIATHHFSEASDLLSVLKNDAANTAICTVLEYIKSLHANPGYVETMRADNTIRLYLKSKLGSDKPLLDTYVKALLEGVYFEKDNEITLQPVGYEAGQGARHGSSETEDSNVSIESLNDKTIRIFPNPASDHLTVQNEDESIHLEIVDLAGKIFIKQDCDKTCQVDIMTLHNGIYLLNLYQQGKFLSTKKLVIIK